LLAAMEDWWPIKERLPISRQRHGVRPPPGAFAL